MDEFDEKRRITRDEFQNPNCLIFSKQILIRITTKVMASIGYIEIS